MPYYDISKEYLKNNRPEALETLQGMLDEDESIDDFDLELVQSVRIEPDAFSFDEMLEKAQKKEEKMKERQKLTKGERISKDFRDQMERSTFTVNVLNEDGLLMAYAKIEEPPTYVANQIWDNLKEQVEEEIRIENLSEEERKEESKEALKELGFSETQINHMNL